MFALIAAILLFLHGFGVLDDSEGVKWLIVSLAFWALHFALSWTLPIGSPWVRRDVNNG